MKNNFIAGLVTATGLTGAPVLWAQTVVPAQRQAAATAEAQDKAPTQLEEMLKGFSMTDQAGKPVDVSALSKGQCVVLFGYGNCPLCAEITKTVSEIQKRMLEADIKDVPIIIISAQPEKDRDNMANYLGGFHISGMKQFASEAKQEEGKARKEIGEEMIAAAKNLPANERILHVLCPENAEQTQEIQKRLAKIAGTPSGTDPKNPKQHTRNLTLITDGKIVIPSDGKGPLIGAKFDRETKEFVATDEMINEQATRFMAELMKQREAAKATTKDAQRAK